MSGDEIRIRVVVPHGAFGGAEDDSLLERMLRAIASAIGPDENWPDKYGADWDSEVFMMHPFCWCEKEGCPWCGGCDCPPEAFHYFVDETEVGLEEWAGFYKQNVPPISDPNWEEVSDRINARRSEGHDKVCNYCLGKGNFSLHGSEPGRGAPHFWHKASEVKVWWYKYIGRDMETMGEINLELCAKILVECLEEVRVKGVPLEVGEGGGQG